jgi:aspartate aminotransferase
MTRGADRDEMLEPLEAFGRLHARTIRRFGPRVIDLSYPSPQFCHDTRAYQLLSELASHATVKELQYPPFGGITQTRRRIASALSTRYGIALGFRDIILTPGGASALYTALRALFTQEDQLMLIAPFWMDYPVYMRDLGISPITVSSKPDKHLDLAAVETTWTPATRGIIISQPACPTGVVYTTDELRELAALLSTLGKKCGTEPILISDEVHRDTVWGGVDCTSPLSLYAESLSIYSFGKAWSMQGQRTGYVALSSRMRQRETLACSLERTLRTTGSYGPTTLMQLLAGRLADLSPHTDDLARMQYFLRERLTALGYEVVPAEATTFVYVRAPGDDDAGFASHAADHGMLVMPSSIFHEPGYFRMALNVAPAELEQALARLASILTGA